MSDDDVKTRPDPYAAQSSGPPSGRHSGLPSGSVPEPSVTPPAQAMEDQVRAAWTAVLGHDDFDDDTPFIEAGGHSLKATQVLMRLRRQLGVRLPNRLFFDHPTVRELAVAVERVVATSPRV
ncbi:acyl carrier protein [Streptomyces sp. NPDC048256]|uniref:acyl carrier protein n=1 Tax=Streptomyces sp. NPDC048256 TaxID=3154613 RepID=UPI0033E442BB